MKTRIILLALLCFPKLYYADQDTALVMALSQPFFYNVITTSGGNIYSGTSEGIIKWDGVESKKINEEPGYVVWEKEQSKPTTKASLLPEYNNHEYLHLLPFPEENRDVFNAATEDHLYLVSEGKIYIFNLLPYKLLNKRESIRSISQDYIGGYKGIHSGDSILQHPSYVSGYIRQIKDTAYLCYDGLKVIKPDTAFDIADKLKDYERRNNINIGYVRDLFFLPDQGYFLATTTGLFLCNPDFDILKRLTPPGFQSEPALIGEIGWQLYYTVNNVLCRFDNRAGISDTTATFPDGPILDGFHQGRSFYLLTENNLYSYNLNTGVESLASFDLAHTVVPVDSKRLIIGSNSGLYLFNNETAEKSTLIPGVEFNRKALYTNKNTLYAGSINGLYEIDISDIPEIITDQKAAEIAGESNSAFSLILLILMIPAAAVAGFFYARSKIKARNRLPEPKPKKITAREVELFVEENLKNAGVKMICDQFGLSAKSLYKLLAPEKPGTIINRMRLKKMSEIQSRGGTVEDICRETGFSISYVRKLISKKAS